MGSLSLANVLNCCWLSCCGAVRVH